MLLQHSNLWCPLMLPLLAPQSPSCGSLHNFSTPNASADHLLPFHSHPQGMHACKSHVRYCWPLSSPAPNQSALQPLLTGRSCLPPSCLYLSNPAQYAHPLYPSSADHWSIAPQRVSDLILNPVTADDRIWGDHSLSYKDTRVTPRLPVSSPASVTSLGMSSATCLSHELTRQPQFHLVSSPCYCSPLLSLFTVPPSHTFWPYFLHLGYQTSHITPPFNMSIASSHVHGIFSPWGF